VNVAEDHSFALDHRAGRARDRFAKDRPCMHERMELSVLAAGIDARR